tara:strand:- start:342 stop:599 length:258 start_codon:yes stop_codon:yes gene_type:complete
MKEISKNNEEMFREEFLHLMCKIQQVMETSPAIITKLMIDQALYIECEQSGKSYNEITDVDYIRVTSHVHHLIKDIEKMITKGVH